MEMHRDPRNASLPHRTFGQLLLHARERCGLSQSELARRSGVTQSALSNVEAGRRRASDSLLEAIAPHLAVKLDRLKYLRDFVAVGGTWPTGIGAVRYARGEHDLDPTGRGSGRFRVGDHHAGSGKTFSLISLFQRLHETQEACGRERPAEADPWLDLYLLMQQMAATEARPDAEPRGGSRQFSLRDAVVSAALQMDEQDLQRTLDFISGMQAGRNVDAGS